MLTTAYCLLSIGLTLAYIGIMLRYLIDWSKTPVYVLPLKKEYHTRVSILVPARNEAANIAGCIDSILAQDYPVDLFELIVIDDHSSDATAAIVQQIHHPNVRLLSLADFIQTDEAIHAYKKKAIEVGIEQAKGTLIVTTDADCMVSPQWLSYLVSYYEQTKTRFIAAPVNFHREQNLLERFQSLDFIGMMGITGAGIKGRYMYMCNGANLAYEKAAFYDLGGFQGIDQLASGDDMLLMEKFAEHDPDSIGFIKNSAARTYSLAQPDWSSFVQQRIRWASKSGNYQKWQVILMLAIVFLFCLNILLSLGLSLLGNASLIGIFIGQLLSKILVDWLFLDQMSRFFDRRDLMRVFLPAQALHIFYIALIGFLANIKSAYQWKGRTTH
ncbi:MAG: glycosyltransferase [Bacteroidota bacterium]